MLRLKIGHYNTDWPTSPQSFFDYDTPTSCVFNIKDFFFPCIVVWRKGSSKSSWKFWIWIPVWWSISPSINYISQSNKICHITRWHISATHVINSCIIASFSSSPKFHLGILRHRKNDRQRLRQQEDHGRPWSAAVDNEALITDAALWGRNDFAQRWTITWRVDWLVNYFPCICHSYLSNDAWFVRFTRGTNDKIRRVFLSRYLLLTSFQTLHTAQSSVFV